MKKKCYMFLLLMALGMMPLLAIAQKQQAGGGLFGRGAIPDPLENNRESFFSPNAGGYNISSQQFGSNDNGGYNIYTQQFGWEAPLDGGWIVLTLAGAAYAMTKRKKNLKK